MRLNLNPFRLLPVGSVVCLLLYLYILNDKELKRPYRSRKTSVRTVHLFPGGRENLTFTAHTPLQSRESGDDGITSRTKLVSLWTPFFGDRNWTFLPRGKGAFAKCRVRDCFVSDDPAMLERSHAVIFHARDLSVFNLPQRRRADQRWIFYSLESPHYSYFDGLGLMNGVFNWTMSYRLDSDVVVTYGRVKFAPPPSGVVRRIGPEAWRKKRRSVVWMVSHCETSSGRERYVDELKKYIDVDVFGACGRAVCPSHRTDDCLKSFSVLYKFYLSFENSVCKDYVTEKFFGILRYDLVPVVMGGADYARLAPPHSYIDALRFSPRQLADYLYRVSANYTLYSSYLEWKSSYLVTVDVDHCRLCSELHRNRSRSVVRDLKVWWVDGAHCRTRTAL